MKCYNCKKTISKDASAYKFTQHIYCYYCLFEYITDECMSEAIELWMDHNTRRIK